MKRFLIFCLSGFYCFTLEAQVDSVRLDKGYCRHYWTDTRDLVFSPVKWDKKDWIGFGIFTGTTTALLFADEPLKDLFQNNRTPFFDHFAHDFLNPFGSTWSGIFSAGYYGIGLMAKNHKMQSTGLLAVESYLIGSLLARIPKVVLGRVRPDTWMNSTPFDWRGPFGGTSFPSGHTVAAFSVASVFAYQYRETLWVPVAAYSLASVVGISRIYENRHWASDVFAGAVLGVITGKFICKSHAYKNYSLVPYINGSLKGITLAYRL